MHGSSSSPIPFLNSDPLWATAGLERCQKRDSNACSLGKIPMASTTEPHLLLSMKMATKAYRKHEQPRNSTKIIGTSPLCIGSIRWSRGWCNIQKI